MPQEAAIEQVAARACAERMAQICAAWEVVELSVLHVDVGVLKGRPDANFCCVSVLASVPSFSRAKFDLTLLTPSVHWSTLVTGGQSG